MAKKKPAKPRKNFPLYAHPNGQWAKTVKGRKYFFGVWGDPEAALRRWLREKDFLEAGLPVPEATGGGVTLADACNAFLTAKGLQLTNAEIGARTVEDYLETAKSLTAFFGRSRLLATLQPRDFEAYRADLAKRLGPVSLANEIGRIRVLFNYAHAAGLMEHPMQYGNGLARPSKSVIRRHRASRPAKLFEASEIRALLDAANTNMAAFILLGINCAFGPSDAGRLPLEAVDLGGGWIDYARGKTGIHRRLPLWPETTDALRASLAARREPATDEAAPLFFITSHGLAFHKEGSKNSPIVTAFGRLLRKLELHKTGRGIYSLRHTFATIGSEALDQVAVNAIMGHADNSMEANYRHGVSDDRLRAVVDHVRAWLFG